VQALYQRAHCQVATERRSIITYSTSPLSCTLDFFHRILMYPTHQSNVHTYTLHRLRSTCACRDHARSPACLQPTYNRREFQGPFLSASPRFVRSCRMHNCLSNFTGNIGLCTHLSGARLSLIHLAVYLNVELLRRPRERNLNRVDVRLI